MISTRLRKVKRPRVIRRVDKRTAQSYIAFGEPEEKSRRYKESLTRQTKIPFAAGLLALILIPGQTLAGSKISLKLQGGWTYISGGDVNHGTQAYFDWREDLWPASEGGYRALHHGFELGGDIIFELSRTLGIGIGSGYLEASRLSQMWLDEGTNFDETVQAEPKLSAIPIRLGLFLTFPLTKRVNLTANAGASYYFQARYSDDWGSWYSPDYSYIHAWITTIAEKRGISLGFDGGLGIEYKLFNKVFVCLDAKGRYARFRGLEGTSEFSSYEYDPFSIQGKLYYESVPMLPDAPRLIMVQSDPPDGPGGEPRLAVVDFSGVSLQAGIRIRL